MTCHIINNDFMSGNYNIMKDFSKSTKFKEHYNFQFYWHQQTFNNAIKVIYLEINVENAIIFFQHYF